MYAYLQRLKGNLGSRFFTHKEDAGWSSCDSKMGSTSRRYALSPSLRLTTVRQVKDLVGEPPQERQVHLKMQYFFFLVFPSPSAVPRSCQGVWQGLSALLSPDSEGLNYFFFFSSFFFFWMLAIFLHMLWNSSNFGLLYSFCKDTIPATGPTSWAYLFH